ncbi:MAG: hypothetical protein WCY15_14745 [Phenylobacterium sp.]|jgi:hypothetical protein|uniref:hypothetical protein n=1 Tax=Phenylobacterium sp. TaxID=1871053 RepID=UPI002A36BCD6|nr:hypothetical protein [Phenylobacterium sp.]MDX9999546.1 hypothetical protein [Phenylobacterium sp.]
MSRFTLTENIRRFRALLAQNVDPARRRTVEMLLAEEERKLARHGDADAPQDSRIDQGGN